jgi:hypothetical protein
LYAASHLALTSDKLLALRARMTTLDPALAKRMAVEAPIPDDAPVIRAGMSVRACASGQEEQRRIEQHSRSKVGSSGSHEQVGRIVKSQELKCGGIDRRGHTGLAD